MDDTPHRRDVLAEKLGARGAAARGGEARQTLDVPHLCGPFRRQGFERALPQEFGQGADRAFGRLRSADPDRLRQRPSAGQGRGRQGRRPRLAYRRHARSVRRHPARRDEHVDDHQRHGAVAARALRRAGRRAKRAAGEAPGHDAERHHQGISLPRHLCVPAGAVDAADQGRDFVHDQGDAEIQSDECLLLSSAGGGRDAGAGTRLRARDRGRRARRGQGLGRSRAGKIRRGGRAHLVLRQCRAALRHRNLQAARLHRIVGRDHARALRRDRAEAAAVPLRRAGQFARPDRAAAGEQRRAHFASRCWR